MKIAIAGGGVGGLTAALLLSHQGHDVTLFEQKDRLGGRLAYESGEGYRIDQGPTIVLLPHMIREVLAEAGMASDDLPLLRCDPMYRLHYRDGTVLTKWSDPDRQAEELSRSFPGEEQGFVRFMTEMNEVFHVGQPAFLDRMFKGKRAMLAPKQMSNLARLKAYRTAKSMVNRYFRDERLRAAYMLQTLYIGGNPLRTPSLYLLISYAEHAYGVWYLRGGYAGLVGMMQTELARRGVVLHTGIAADVAIRDGRCEGVRVNGGFEAFDRVVINGDPDGNVGWRTGLRKGALRSRRYRPSSGCLLIYAGCGRRWPDLGMHQFYMPDRFEAGMRQLFGEGRIPEDPAYYIFNPVSMDEGAAPAGESVLYFLVPVPSGQGRMDWQEEGPRLAENIMEDAERRGLEGLRASLRWLSIRTPEDAARDGLYEGGSFGIAPNFLQSGPLRPQIPHPRIRGLYRVGASVHPGGGIPIVMNGARLLARRIEEEMR